MPTDTDNSHVARQYEQWVYPRPIEDLDAMTQNGKIFADNDPAIRSHVYWPDREYWEGMKILVAGCGANQAALTAYSNPTARVTGIDLSNASLDHENRLKKKHDLSNLTLQQLSLEDTVSLNDNFDLIITTGVLHHLPDPAIGLKALKQVLRRDGVIDIMLYGKYDRAGVYMLQELFSILGLEQDDEGLEIVRATLDALPPKHPVQSYISSAPDLGYDSGVVDTFLHRQDIAYTVQDCLDLLADSGLEFQGWFNNSLYYPDARVPSGHPLLKKMAALGDPEIWRVMELYSGRISRHQFFCCRPDRPREDYVIEFDGEAFLALIPVQNINEVDPPGPHNQQRTLISTRPHPPVALDTFQASLFQLFDGHNTVQDCIRKIGAGSESPEFENQVREFLQHLWRAGVLLFKKRPR